MDDGKLPKHVMHRETDITKLRQLDRYQKTRLKENWHAVLGESIRALHVLTEETGVDGQCVFVTG